MNTSAKTESKSTPNNPAHDLDPAGGKAKPLDIWDRTYRSDYLDDHETMIYSVLTSEEKQAKVELCISNMRGNNTFRLGKEMTPQLARDLAAWLVFHADRCEELTEEFGK